MKKLTIITINYNKKYDLEKTIVSVLNQNCRDFEYIVIDGGSDDGSLEVIKKNETDINYWVSERDKGIYNAMNKGILAANGEYVLFINSGDELYDTNLVNDVLNELHTNDIITGDLNFISENTNRIGKSSENISFFQLYQDTIWLPCTFIKKSRYLETGFYDENLKICSDWKWFFLAILKYKLSYRKINRVISKFYLDGISSDIANKGIIGKERATVINDFFNGYTEDIIKLDKLIADSKQFEIQNKKINKFKKTVIYKILSCFRIIKHL